MRTTVILELALRPLEGTRVSRHPAQAGLPRGSTLGNSDLEPLIALGDLVPNGIATGGLESTLRGLAKVAVQVVHGAEAASLTVLGADGVPRTLVFTSVLAQRMDILQYRANQGPCLQAATATEWTAVLVSDLRTETRWPAINAEGPRLSHARCCRPACSLVCSRILMFAGQWAA